MNVSEAVASRISCRAFLEKDVPQEIIREILGKARRAPSGGNLQPWHVHVLRGQAVQDVSNLVLEKIQSGVQIEKSEYHIYPPKLPDPYRARRSRCGEMLYATLEIAREDKAARQMQFLENYRFFGAPVAHDGRLPKRARLHLQDLADAEHPVRHDSEKLAQTIMDVYDKFGGWR